MEVSKFKIGNNIIDVKDAQARDDVVAAMNAAQDAQSTADLKLNASDAWKCGQLSKTFNNVTITSHSTYGFVFDVPDGATNAIPTYIRSADATRPLIPTNLYRHESQFHAHMLNLGAELSNATITLQITYMYI